MSVQVLLIDNYDSFTFNLVQALAGLGAEVQVRRHDEVAPDDLDGRTHLCVSPGPGRPSDAGASCALIEAALSRSLPTLGVCLGHQCLVEVFGGTIVRGRRVMHGKASRVHHDRSGLFARLPSPFVAGRYHSLVAQDPLPDGLALCAWTSDGEVQGVRNASGLATGVQFHPESLLTPRGDTLLQAFLDQRGAA